jgi:hypothetical protein
MMGNWAVRGCPGQARPGILSRQRNKRAYGSYGPTVWDTTTSQSLSLEEQLAAMACLSAKDRCEGVKCQH